MTSIEERRASPESTDHLKKLSDDMLQESLQWRGAIRAVQAALVALKEYRDGEQCDCHLRDFEAWLAEDLRRAESRFRCAADLQSDMDFLDEGMSLEKLARIRKARRMP